MPKRKSETATMRPLVIKDLPETVQIAIKKRSWRDDISYEEEVAELLHDAEIERIAARDVARSEKHHRFDDDLAF